MSHQSSMRGARRALRLAGVAAAAAVLGGCNLFETSVNNPNAVPESQIATGGQPLAVTLTNGLGSAVIRAMAAVLGPNAVVSDELTWVGSREAYRQLDEGQVTDPRNEYTNENGFPFTAEARWYADFVTEERMPGLLATVDSVRIRPEAARALLYSAMIHTMIGEMYDDFVLTRQRAVETPNIGVARFDTMFVIAIDRATRGLALATAAGNAGLRRDLTAIRARARHSRAIKAQLRAARAAAAAGTSAAVPASPLINDPDVTADAQAAIALMAPGYRFQFVPQVATLPGISVGFEMNNRLETRVGALYINPNAAGTRPADGLAGIRLTDIANATATPDAALARIIDECCRQVVDRTMPMTVLSEVDMQLILAEAALATGNNPGFETAINAVRARSGKPAITVAGLAALPTPITARDLLIHERRVNLFLQFRRLMDHYRFGITADRWVAQNIAIRRHCFFPISFGEKLSNRLAQPQPAEQGTAECR